MTYGETLKKLFDAHILDIQKPETRFTHPALKQALKEVPKGFLSDAYFEFLAICETTKKHVLDCPHKNTTIPYSGREECNDCGCYRDFEHSEELNMWSNGKWGEWQIL